MADYFSPPPQVVLADADALLAALDGPIPDGMAKYQIRSDFIIGVIDDIAATGYPYNNTVQREVERRLGINRQSDNDSYLSALVYNAQGFRRTRDLVAAGYQPFTRELLTEAHKAGMKIAYRPEIVIRVFVDGKLLDEDEILTPREIDGVIYAMMPRSRTKYRSPEGQPVKLVPRKK